jgi:integrase
MLPKLATPTTGNQILYQDAEQPGLAVRVTRGGARAFVVDRNTERGRIRITLGDANPATLTVFNARLQAAHVVGLIGKGATAAQIRAALAREDGGIEPGAATCGDVLDEYLRVKRNLAPRTAYDYRRLFGLLPEKGKPDPRGPSGPLSDWRRRAIAGITKNDVREKFLAIESPSQANYAMRLMRALFNYAATMTTEDGAPLVTDNPVKVLSAAKLWHRQAPKREVIRPHELQAWWRAVEALGTTPAERGNSRTARDFLHFLVLTGLRRSEAAGLRWETVELAGRFFTIETTKNQDPHTLPTSDYLQAMLERRHQANADLPEAERSQYVFPGHDGPLAEPKKQIRKVIAASGVSFSAHTLRRTFGTIAESLDIPAYALKRLMNHRAGGDVTFTHYVVMDIERLRAPMQKITDYVLKAAGVAASANVVSLPGAAAT